MCVRSGRAVTPVDARLDAAVVVVGATRDLDARRRLRELAHAARAALAEAGEAEVLEVEVRAVEVLGALEPAHT